MRELRRCSRLLNLAPGRGATAHGARIGVLSKRSKREGSEPYCELKSRRYFVPQVFYRSISLPALGKISA
jgi:hypothetical protein